MDPSDPSYSPTATFAQPGACANVAGRRSLDKRLTQDAGGSDTYQYDEAALVLAELTAY